MKEALELPKKRRLFKVVLIGDAQVGKTAIMQRWVNNRFESYKQTIGADFLTKETEDKNTLQVWDIAGEERYRTGVGQVYRGADAFVFVLDGSKRLTEIPEHVKRQLKEVNEARLSQAKWGARQAKFYFAINKRGENDQLSSDFKDQATAEKSLKKFLNKVGITLPDSEVVRNTFLCSPETGENVNELFAKIEKDAISASQLEESAMEEISQKTISLMSQGRGEEEEMPPTPRYRQIWRGVNVALLLSIVTVIILASLGAAGVLTLGIAPAIVFGALVVTAIACNLGFKFYENSKDGSPPPSPDNPEDKEQEFDSTDQGIPRGRKNHPRPVFPQESDSSLHEMHSDKPKSTSRTPSPSRFKDE